MANHPHSNRENYPNAESNAKKSRLNSRLPKKPVMARNKTKNSKRLVRAGKQENDDCIHLLQLMGVPVIQAPCKAEAQAASMARAGLVYAVGTKDMNALTFRAPILLRKMTFATAGKSDIQTMDYDRALAALDLTHDQFVELCILMGCDYCHTHK